MLPAQSLQATCISYMTPFHIAPSANARLYGVYWIDHSFVLVSIKVNQGQPRRSVWAYSEDIIIVSPDTEHLHPVVALCGFIFENGPVSGLHVPYKR